MERMMIRTYAMKITKNIDIGILQQLETIISTERWEKTKKYHFEEDKKRSIMAEVILRHALKKNFGITRENVQFTTNRFGKPMLKNFEHIHFNLAHSGDWVVCGVSNDPIGIDVEIIKCIDLDIAKSFFTSNEYNVILNQPKDKQIKYFYKFWTLKESYVKAEGKGLSIPLDSFSFCILPHSIHLFEGNQLSNKYCFRVFNLDDIHTVAVCSKKLSEEAISIVSIENIDIG
jgi:4'-phosphopantetheinyl transferase